MADKAHAFMEANREDPFLVYLPFAHPHTGCIWREGLDNPVAPEFEGISARGGFGDVVAEMDHVVGRVLGSLTNLGLDEHTVVFFASDNGPWRLWQTSGGSVGIFAGTYATHNLGYTDTGKGTTWEGGA